MSFITMLQLSDASQAAQWILRETAQIGGHGSVETAGIAPWYDHALACMCLSWHRRWMSDSEVDRIDQSQFRLLARSVPRWDSAFDVVPFWCSIPAPLWRPYRSGARQPQSTVEYLHCASEIPELICRRAKLGKVDAPGLEADTIPLYRAFVVSLCGAWSLWTHGGKETEDRQNIAGSSDRIQVPNWNLGEGLQLVELDWRLPIEAAGPGESDRR